MKTQKILVAIVLIFTFISFSQISYADIVDTNPPVITLIGSPTVNINVGDTYNDEGATALDDVDGDITVNIVKTGSVDTTLAGSYTINFDVSDSAHNNATTVSRTIIVNEVQQTPKETIFIRNGDSVVYSGNIDLPVQGNVDITDNSGVVHQVNNRSVLGFLYALDQTSDSFSLSNLQYYDSFSSFYIKCITPSGTSELCDSWQYVVGGTSPWTSVDSTFLTGGETIALYFGNPYRVNLSSTNITTSDTITAKSESYNYTDNTWSVRTGVTIGVTVPNPNDPWNPNVVSTYPVDTNGEAILSFTTEGTYTVGISEDYYFPSYTVIVSKTSGGGGGGGGTPTSISIPQALAFLASNQKPNGSFGDMLYTDWAAIAISGAGSQAQSLRGKIFDYLKNNPYQSNTLTDNERHAMALMSLGINPYSDTGTDYIKKITNSFDGTQFGDSSLYNDDIFAIIVLSKAGFTSNDEIIKKDVSFIISKQQGDGSWGSVDMTGAGIQALRSFSDLSGVSQSITLAESYLVNSQDGGGGFGNSSSTSWAMQALSMNGGLSSKVTSADKYLAQLQDKDGGLDSTGSLENRIWSTSYAIPASLHVSWNSILQSFLKQSNSNGDINNNPTPAPIPVITQIKTEDPIKKVTDDVKPVIKKKKKLKNTDKKEALQASEKNNPLTASAADALSSESPSPSVFRRIINAIESPFVWLFVKLGF
jgi:hypothetical protein